MDYWKKRTLASEDKATRLAASYSKRQREALTRTYKRLENYLNAMFTELEYGGVDYISRTDLWRCSKYLELEEEIRKELQSVGIKQIDDIKEVLSKVYDEVLETDLADLLENSKQHSFQSKSLLKQNLNASWSGEDYSKRVWKNTNELAARLSDHITDMVTLGRSPTDIKKQVIRDFNTSYNVADRLIRTEASHAFNSASIDSYKQAGVKYVEIIPERDGRLCALCSKVASKNNGIYPIDEAPTLPLHPRCRCCYAPVVNLRENIGNLDIDVDEFVPCLKNSKTGEIVDTVAEKVDKKSLKGYNIKNGWYIDWNKVPDDVEVHALKIKGSERIEGLIGLKKDPNMMAMYIHWGVAAPHNNKLKGVKGEKEYIGVGGHLFAIAAEESINNGYDGYFYGFAANKDLAEYYCNKFGAVHRPIDHPYEVIFDEFAANSILKEYNYERKNK